MTEDGSDISADNDNPIEDGAEITDESESADMTEDSADISADDLLPDDDGAEITDESESADMTENSADISADNDIPTEDGAEITDESESTDMTEDSADIFADNDIPTEDGAEITDEDIPTEDGANITVADDGEISFTGGVLIAVLMVGAMFVMYSCLNSYQMRMMEQIRKIKNKVYDLEQKLDNQGESLAEVRQYLSKTEPGKTEQPRSTAARPSGSAGYIEPFGGSGAVLLGKPQRDRFEVYNDKNKNLVNLFMVIRERPAALIQELGYHHLNSRDDFKVYKKAIQKEEFTSEYMDEEMELTYRLFSRPQADEIRDIYLRQAEEYDVHRAAMFFLLIKFSYSSSCKSFGCQPCSIRGVFGQIWEMSRRLDGVDIENQDFEVLIRHYDRPGDFIYCDPPYFESEYVYDCGFSWEDHLRLRETLGGIDGKFLVSYNDCPEIRELYRGYEFFDFKRIHPMVQKYEAGRQFPELLIANYDLYEREKTKPRQISLLDDDSDSKAMERILRNGILQK